MCKCLRGPREITCTWSPSWVQRQKREFILNRVSLHFTSPSSERLLSNQSVQPSIHLSAHASICPSTNSLIQPSIYLSIYPLIHISVHPHIHPHTYIHLRICLYIHTPIHPPMRPSSFLSHACVVCFSLASITNGAQLLSFDLMPKSA